jgi:hypothetical protein
MMSQATKRNNPVASIPQSKLIMARRRISIALCTLEDGIFNLFTTENVVELLSAALGDLEEAELIEQGVNTQRGLDWNAYEPVVER